MYPYFYFPQENRVLPSAFRAGRVVVSQVSPTWAESPDLNAAVWAEPLFGPRAGARIQNRADKTSAVSAEPGLYRSFHGKSRVGLPLKHYLNLKFLSVFFGIAYLLAGHRT